MPQDASSSAFDHARRAALRAREAGRRHEALEAFRAALAFNERDLWTRNDIAAELTALGRLEEAEDAYRAVAAGTPLAHTVRGLGLIARQQGNLEEALDCFRVAARLLPSDAWFALDIGLTLGALRRLEDADRAFGEVIGAHPGFAPAYRERAALATRQSRHEAARRDLEEALALRPGDPDLTRELGECLLRLGDAAGAETLFARLLVSDPAQFEAYRGLARIARERGERDVAAAHLRAAASRFREPARRLALAAEWATLGDVREARKLYEAMANEPEAGVAPLLDFASLTRRTEGPLLAKPLLERALEREPGNPRALLMMGDLLREMGQFIDAETYYDTALEARPDFYWALVGKALTARGRGDQPAAFAFFERAVAVDPYEGHAQIEWANDLRELGDWQAARAKLAAVPGESPRAFHAAMAAARIHRASGDWLEGMAAFEALAERYGAEAEPLIEAAEDAFRAGKDRAAERYLDEATRRAPNHPALSEALARRALIRDDQRLALSLFRKAKAEDPARLWPYLASARIEASLGQREEADAAFAEVEARFGPRPETAIAQAELERLTGNIQAADRRLAQARARFPTHAGLWLQTAIGDLDAGRFDAVEAALGKAHAATRIDQGRAHFVRSMLAAARWDFATAIEASEQAAALLPADGWVRNRLIHAALLGLDLDRAEDHLGALAALEASSSRLRGKSANPSQSHYGQIFDDFRLDAEALGALKDAMALPAGDLRLSRLSELLRVQDEHTATAISFMIELRRAGRFDGAFHHASPSRIPPVIHQYWDEPEPPADIASMMASWRSHNPGMTHRVWDDRSAQVFLAETGQHDTLAAYRRAVEPAMKADLFRLALLYREGGIYADSDDLCLKPLAPLFEGAAFVAYQEDLGSLGNNFIAVAPGHPITGRALRLATEAVNRGDTDILWLSTGPGLLTRAAAGILATGAESVRTSRILARHEFLAYAAIHCLAAYKTTERHWSRTAFGRVRRPNKAQATSAA